MKRRLIFRADANETIGRGHLSRCVAIASMLKDDITILFVSLKSNKAFVANLLGDFKSQFIEKEEDLIQIIQPEDLLWIDGYHFSEDWKKEMQANVKKLIETNDIPYTPKYVDILFNQTPGLTKEQFGGDASSAALYLGLDYVLLRQQFLTIARTNKPILNGNGVFICFGGADTYNLGEKFVSELVRLKFKDPIYWVINSKNVDSSIYNENVSILSNLSEKEMIHYMTIAKVLLIPSSVLSFEAMALRKPFYTGYFVDNQELIAQGLKEEGLAEGYRNLEINEEFEKAFEELLMFYSDEAKQKELVREQQKSIDGNSPSRIITIINSL